MQSIATDIKRKDFVVLHGYTYTKDALNNLHRHVSPEEYNKLLGFYSTSIYFGQKFWGAELLKTPTSELATYKTQEESKAYEFKSILLDSIKNFGSSGNLLEIGCGIGSFLNQLVDSELTLSGYDISKFAKPGSENVWGINRYSITECEIVSYLEKHKQTNKWDYIVSFDFLEHIELDNILLQRLKAMLKVNGKLILEIPIFETTNFTKLEISDFLYPEHHIHLYNEAGLDHMFRSLSFRILTKIKIRNNQKIFYILEV